MSQYGVGAMLAALCSQQILYGSRGRRRTLRYTACIRLKFTFGTGTKGPFLFFILGVRGEDLQVTVDGDTLRISGVRLAPEPAEVVRLQQMEIATGPFERRLRIPISFDREGVTAHLASTQSGVFSKCFRASAAHALHRSGTYAAALLVGMEPNSRVT